MTEHLTEEIYSKVSTENRYVPSLEDKQKLKKSIELRNLPQKFILLLF
jgi:hypothetical protein